jgi:hypothetical protein
MTQRRLSDIPTGLSVPPVSPIRAIAQFEYVLTAPYPVLTAISFLKIRTRRSIPPSRTSVTVSAIGHDELLTAALHNVLLFIVHSKVRAGCSVFPILTIV